MRLSSGGGGGATLSPGLPPRSYFGGVRLFGEGGFDGGDDLGVVGFGSGGEARDDGAIAADEEFFEVPGDVAFGGGLGVEAGEVFVEGCDVVTFDADFGEHGEGDVVLAGAELFDFFVRAGLLFAEVVGGESEDDEAFVFVLLVGAFEGGVLGGVAALAGDVDDEDDFAGVLGEVDVFAVDVFHCEGEGGGWRGGGAFRGEGEAGECCEGEGEGNGDEGGMRHVEAPENWAVG